MADVTPDVTPQDPAAEASAAAHDPVRLTGLFETTADGGPKVDPQVLAQVCEALTARGQSHIVTPGHPAADGTGGFNLRASVASAKGEVPQYFTVQERHDPVTDLYYWRVVWRTEPTKDRSKKRTA